MNAQHTKLGGESVYSTGLRTAAYALGRYAASDAVPHVFWDGLVRPGAVVGEGRLSGSRKRGHLKWRIIASMRSRDGHLQRWYCRKHGFDIVARVVRASAFAMQLDVEVVDERGDRRMAMDDRGDVGR